MTAIIFAPLSVMVDHLRRGLSEFATALDLAL
jgi:hypothetical protein